MELDNTQIRQGDVLLVRVKDVPEGETEKRDSDGSATLAHGEVTGHRHRFTEIHVQVSKGAKVRHLRVVETEAFLLHEEHTAPKVLPGDYELPKQVEWNDALEPRVVAD